MTTSSSSSTTLLTKFGNDLAKFVLIELWICDHVSVVVVVVMVLVVSTTTLRLIFVVVVVMLHHQTIVKVSLLYDGLYIRGK